MLMVAFTGIKTKTKTDKGVKILKVNRVFSLTCKELRSCRSVLTSEKLNKLKSQQVVLDMSEK